MWIYIRDAQYLFLGVETVEETYSSPGDQLGKFKIVRCLKGIYGPTPANTYALLLCLDRVQMSFYHNSLDGLINIKKRIYDGGWTAWVDLYS